MLTLRSHSLAAVAAFFAALCCVANATSISINAPAHNAARSI